MVLCRLLDAEAVRQITLHTDAYDSRFEERLSSVVEISTRPEGAVERHGSSEVGIAGVGGSMTRPWGEGGSLFISGRQSVLHLLTNDNGMNGVPKYRNAFARAEKRRGPDSWWGISLTGIDAISMHPSATDSEETSAFDVAYSGWRNTTGVNWQHVFSARSYGVASVANAEQTQTIAETGQLQGDALVYRERTLDGMTTVKYDWTLAVGKRLTLTTGARGAVDRMDYAVEQPMGLANPYSEDPAPLDATGLGRRFAAVSAAGYGQAEIGLGRGARLVVGGRGMQWALGGRAGMTGKALVSAPVLGRMAHVGYAEYEQMAPTLYLLSFDNVKRLGPIRSRQVTGGVDLVNSRRVRVTLEGYEKRYANYPVAVDHPEVSLANVADTFGQAFLMFPMTGKGTGVARGVELSAVSHLSSRLNVTATLVYARSWYAGLDGVLRRANYDLPVSANVTGVWSVGRGTTLSWRYSAASGKPYTPDNLALSAAQNRDVYDLTRVNGLRSRAYERLDFRLEHERKVVRGIMMWHVGLQNALNRKNFYSQTWEPRMAGGGVAEQDQMPLFPDGGVRFRF